MAKNKKKQPSKQDFINVINNIIQDIHSLQNDMNAIMGTFDMYVDFKVDTPGFKNYIDNKIKNANKGSDELQATEHNNTVANQTNSQN